MQPVAVNPEVRRKKPWVRPWALAVPILVLLFCLPLLRPLRQPGRASQDEQLRLATIAALVEHRSDSGPLAERLAIDTHQFVLSGHVFSAGQKIYSDQPPMLAFLMSGPALLLYWLGFSLRPSSVFTPYILTLLGVTLPVAGAAGLVYRMGRIFELKRQWRTGLAAAVVFGTGLISYAVVFNSHAPAAVLVMASVACLVHIAASPSPSRGGGWLILAGFCAALAATIDPSAVVFLILLLIVVPALRLRFPLRIGGMILYIFGAAPPILLHAMLTVPLTGDLLPGSLHPEMAVHHRIVLDEPAIDATADSAFIAQPTDFDDALDANPPVPTLWQKMWRGVGTFFWTFIGEHGVLVHFPVVVFGVIGMFAVMHRHWPGTTKILAATSAIATLIGIIGFCISRYGPTTADFGNRWLLVFLPFLFFWAGAWLRQPHSIPAWTLAAVLLAFSVLVSLVGATNPMPAGGYSRYTAMSAFHQLLQPSPQIEGTALAAR